MDEEQKKKLKDHIEQKIFQAVLSHTLIEASTGLVKGLTMALVCVKEQDKRKTEIKGFLEELCQLVEEEVFNLLAKMDPIAEKIEKGEITRDVAATMVEEVLDGKR